MKNFIEVINGILQEIQPSPNLTSQSRTQIAFWLAAGNTRGLFKELATFLSIAEEAGFTNEQVMDKLTVALEVELVLPVQTQFFRNVPLPPGLTRTQLHKALNQTQTIITRLNHSLYVSTGSPLTHFIQANNFSGIVSNIVTNSLHQVSSYKHNHEQRFPDLRNPTNGAGLEIKATNKPGKGGESHNGHGGWHLIACFELDETSGNILFVHIEVAQLISYMEEAEGDWHYCGSTVNATTGSRRTETYYTTGRGTSRLRDGSVFLDTERVSNWKRWRHHKSYPIPAYSPLYFQRLDNQLRVPALSNPDKLVTWSSVKPRLNQLDPLWPLYNHQQLQDIGVPLPLADVIRP